VKATLVVKRLHILNRQMPNTVLRVLGWIHRNGWGLEEVETCPPATLIKPRVFCEGIVQNVYTAFVASVDTTLHTRV
jgi:hypothetical protein